MRIGTVQDKVIDLDINTLNRHGIIAGSSGSGKTTTIKTLVKGLNDNDVPTLLFDAKGDLKDLLQAHKGTLYTFKGDYGVPLNTSISTLNIDLLSNILALNNTQHGILATAFLIAKDKDISLTTIEDLEDLFIYMINNNESLSIQYGRLSNVSISTIRRKINTLKLNDLQYIFDYDNFDYQEIINNKQINIIDSVELVKYPKLYASIVVMVLRQFYDNLQDSEQDTPKTIIFIDEAHLLFKDTNKNMIQDIIQIVKLIRSKGIGLFFISQSIDDVPNEILGQLSTKIQHHLNLITTQDYSKANAITKAFTSTKKEQQQALLTLKDLSIGQAFIQYLSDNDVVNELVQVDYVVKDIISEDRLNEFKALQATEEDTGNQYTDNLNPSVTSDMNNDNKKIYAMIMIAITTLMILAQL